MTTALAEPKNPFYAAVLPAEATDVRQFKPEDFVPLSGTVLIIMPDKEDRSGTINLPERVQADPSFARVAAIPDDPNCPVKPGDFVIFNPGAPEKLRFGNRDDIYFVRYCDGPESEITGYIPGGSLDRPGTPA